MRLARLAPPPIPPARVAPPPIPLRLGAVGCFTGRAQAFRRILLRGALLRVVTLGIYRFWLTTETRCFLWANTEIGGDSLEYSGTARELLLGCLKVIALLAPAYALLLFWLAGSPDFGVAARLSSVGAAAFLGVLGQYARYRARGYRLTRTAFRGIRFHQSGSAVAYALRSLLWGMLTALTLGLAYPWAQASLEHYKLAHTHYGSWRGKFAGSGTQLFVRGIGLWLMLMAAAVACGVVVSQCVDLDAMSHGLRDAPKINQQRGTLVLLGLGMLLLAGIAGLLLRAIVLRWWLEGLRIGPLAVATSLRKRSIIGAYLRCSLYVALLVIGVLIAVGAAVDSAPDFEAMGDVGQLATVGVSGAAYLVTVLGVWTLHQTTVKLRIWRLAVDSISIAGFGAITTVRADSRRPGSAVGERLADAFHAGGM
jgi:uncharacterized membrane protein YjgN (DUF898 family)